MTNTEFEQVYYPRYNSKIQAIARKIAQRNDALADELYQEGLMALWQLNPKGATNNEDAYIRQAVKFRMIDYLRREHLARFESLTAHLERGDQVVRDEDTGETKLVTLRETHRRNTMLDDDESRAAVILEDRNEER